MRLSELRRNGPPAFGGLPGQVDPVTPERALYNQVLEMFANCPQDVAIMQSDLVSEVENPQATAVQRLVFNIRSDQQNPTNAIRPTENRLETRDAFVVDRLGVSWGVQGVGATPDQVYYQQFPNANTVANNGHTPAGALAIRQALNGNMDGLINTVQYLRNLKLSRVIYVDTAQASSATTQSAQEGDLGFVRMTPAMTIRGSDTAQFQIQIPNPALFDAGANTILVARLTLRGLLIQGGAEYLRSLDAAN